MEPCQRPVGAARLGSNGELILHLRAEAKEGVVGDALILIPRSDPRHAKYIQHIGGLREGEEKSVPPWGCEAHASTA